MCLSIIPLCPISPLSKFFIIPEPEHSSHFSPRSGVAIHAGIEESRCQLKVSLLQYQELRKRGRQYCSASWPRKQFAYLSTAWTPCRCGAPFQRLVMVEYQSLVSYRDRSVRLAISRQSGTTSRTQLCNYPFQREGQRNLAWGFITRELMDQSTNPSTFIETT